MESLAIWQCGMGTLGDDCVALSEKYMKGDEVCAPTLRADAFPVRVQLSRKAGWRMPENTVSVARPSQWGNKFMIGGHFKRYPDGSGVPRYGWRFIYMQAAEGHQDATYTTIKSNAEAVEWFEWYMGTWSPVQIEGLRDELRGKNLACWCKDGPCHADVLLRIANG